jgi:hypothetical protein
MSGALARASQLAKELARTYLNAAVFRVVWSLPLGVVLVSAALIFLFLTFAK